MIKKIKVVSFLLCLLVGAVNAQNLSSVVNDSYENELNPSLSLNGKIIAFERALPTDKNKRGYMSTFHPKTNTWSTPQEIGGYIENDALLNGGYYVNSTGNAVWFYSNRPGSLGGVDLYYVEKNKLGQWQEPVNAGELINAANAHEIDPSISLDEKTLYFARVISGKRTPEGTPCAKLFFSEKNYHGQWKMPEALPATINRGCECSPRILPDGKTLIFAAMVEGNAGGFDLYWTRKNADGEWSNPLPLTAVNTSKDDRYPFVTADYSLYYSQSKKSSADIAKTTLSNEVTRDKMALITGYVKEGKAATIPKITLTPFKTNKPLTYIGRSDGSYIIPIFEDDDYDISITSNESAAYTFSSTHLNLKPTQQYEDKVFDATIQKFKVGVKFPVHIKFKNNSDTIDESTIPELNRIGLMARLNISLFLEIVVHTDHVQKDTVQKPGFSNVIIDTISHTFDEFNHEIVKVKKRYSSDNTYNQAFAIAKALEKRGCTLQRLKVTGKGASEPLNPAPPKKEMNKRVELIITHE